MAKMDNPTVTGVKPDFEMFRYVRRRQDTVAATVAIKNETEEDNEAPEAPEAPDANSVSAFKIRCSKRGDVGEMMHTTEMKRKRSLANVEVYPREIPEP